MKYISFSCGIRWSDALWRVCNYCRMQNLGSECRIVVHAKNLEINIQRAVEFAEKQNVKLLYHLVLLGNHSDIGAKITSKYS